MNLSASTPTEFAIGPLAAVVSVACFLALIVYVGWRDRRRLAIWFRLKPSSALLGCLAGACLLGFGWLYGQTLARGDLDTQDYMAMMQSLFPSPWILLAFGAVLAPLAEELYLRGRLYDLVQRRKGAVAAILVTSVVFALMHLVPSLLPAYLVYGLVLAGLRHYTGGLVAPLIAHAINNGVALWPMGG